MKSWNFMGALTTTEAKEGQVTHLFEIGPSDQ